MAVLNIRNLPDDVHARLRLRAARAGRSMEAEARDILIQACKDSRRATDPQALLEWIDDLYGEERPRAVVDTLLAERRAAAERE